MTTIAHITEIDFDTAMAYVAALPITVAGSKTIAPAPDAASAMAAFVGPRSWLAPELRSCHRCRAAAGE